MIDPEGEAMRGVAVPGGIAGARFRSSYTGAPGFLGEASEGLVSAMALPSFLRLAGKREIRPGGKHGWDRLIKLLGLVGGERVLLVSTHWKRGRLPVGLDVDGVSVVTLDALPIGVLDAGAFDLVIIEDELAYLDASARAGVLAEARRVLRADGRLAIHELYWRQLPSREVLREMAEVWGRVPSPMTMDECWEALDRAGFAPKQWHIGALGWFREKQCELDEGLERAAVYFARANEPSPIGRRLTKALAHGVEHARFYGWVVMMAGMR